MSAVLQTSNSSLHADFERDGLVKVSGLLDRNWLDLLAEAAEEIRDAVKREHPEVIQGGSLYSENAWTFNEKLRRFVLESGVVQAAAEAMDSRTVRLFESLMIYKEEGCDNGTGWHQDMSQHGITGRQTCSIWLSLDPVTEDTGALRVVPGSHLGPWYTPMCMPPGREADLIELEGGPLPDPDADRKRFPDILSFPTQPGDVLLLHPAALHSTRANPSRARRRTFSIRLLGDDIRRKALRCEWHSWLKELPIRDGEPMIGDKFPQLWPR